MDRPRAARPWPPSRALLADSGRMRGRAHPSTACRRMHWQNRSSSAEIAKRRRRPRVLQAPAPSRCGLRRGTERSFRRRTRSPCRASAGRSRRRRSTRVSLTSASTGPTAKHPPITAWSSKSPNDGQIVASYAIESHFDIRRDYNPQTGEELNIVVENESDLSLVRARAYFRVEWSKNLVTDSYDFDTLASLGVSAASITTPSPIPCSTPSTPTRPTSTTTRVISTSPKSYATPQIVDLRARRRGRPIPGLHAFQLFRGRHRAVGQLRGPSSSPSRVIPPRAPSDYEPADTTGSVSRCWAAQFRLPTQLRAQLRHSRPRLDAAFCHVTTSGSAANTTPIRQEEGPIACASRRRRRTPPAIQRRPNRDEAGTATADECARRASVPLRRVHAKMRAAVSPTQTEDDRLVHAPRHVALEPDQWAVLEGISPSGRRSDGAGSPSAAGSAAATSATTNSRCGPASRKTSTKRCASRARVDACRRSRFTPRHRCIDLARAGAGTVAEERGAPDEASARAIGTIAAMDPIIVLCHNPVIAADHAACGKAGLVARPGDLRYNIVLNIKDPQTPSPWGIMVDGNDPLTGEKVAGSMNVWTHATDMVAQQLVDWCVYVNGELTTEQITNGSYVRDWAGAAALGPGTSLPLLSMPRSWRDSTVEPSSMPRRSAVTRGTRPAGDRSIRTSGKARALDVQARATWRRRARPS